MTGIGWLSSKHCRLVQKCGFTDEAAWYDLIGAQGWIHCNWSKENEASFWGSEFTYKTPSYIEAEYRKQLEKRSHQNPP